MRIESSTIFANLIVIAKNLALCWKDGSFIRTTNLNDPESVAKALEGEGYTGVPISHIPDFLPPNIPDFLPPISHIPDFLPPNIPYPRFHSQLTISQILQD